MLPTTFKARQLTLHTPQPTFKAVLAEHWPAYKHWYTSKISDVADPQRLRDAQQKLAATMPELIPVYDRLRELTNDDPIAARFLTGYQPPAYLVSCSQAVFATDTNAPMLIRNYDLSPTLAENLVSHTQWLEQTVMGTNECLWGLDDGINQAGLAASLTFGGSNKTGKGFGIPFIMRYVLETCETVKQAITVLKRVPSHMAYNVTLLDKSGDFATIMLAPDQPAIITRERCITNHQQQVTWPEQAEFSKTIERKNYLDQLLADPLLDKSTLRAAFLSKPLHSVNYAQQFGTVYTAVYQPAHGTMEYHWPDQPPLKQHLAGFTEQDRTIDLSAIYTPDPDLATTRSTEAPANYANNTAPTGNDEWVWKTNVQQGIPMHIRPALLNGLRYLPDDSVNQKTLAALIAALHHQDDFSWASYGQQLAALSQATDYRAAHQH